MEVSRFLRVLRKIPCFSEYRIRKYFFLELIPWYALPSTNVEVRKEGQWHKRAISREIDTAHLALGNYVTYLLMRDAIPHDSFYFL